MTERMTAKIWGLTIGKNEVKEMAFPFIKKEDHGRNVWRKSSKSYVLSIFYRINKN
jgi:hypothetical protein